MIFPLFEFKIKTTGNSPIDRLTDQSMD